MTDTTYGAAGRRITVDQKYQTTTITDGDFEDSGRVTVDFRDLSSLVDALTQIRNELADGPCPYTFSHTRHWCGHAGCRDS